jgi:ribonucleoside-diphosphate reductase alpha chain
MAVLERDLETHMGLTPNALTVLEKRYLKKDLKGQIVEHPEDMFRRVAKTVAKADLFFDPDADVMTTEEKFYRIMANLEFMPNSPTLMNAGRELGQLSACFVLPVKDSIDSIFEAVKHAAIIHKSGGGTGFSFSRIRPEKDPVKTTRGVASGPVSFMNIFDVATETIKQGGTRRGANMGILSCEHPDIEKFISAKIEKNRLNNFNISVAITDSFMRALEKGTCYELINPHTGEVTGRLDAQEVFDKIAYAAWGSGDPGVIFLDSINRANPIPHVGNIEATNPCGEQPLLPYESCNLGSINLSSVVENGEIDYAKLRELTRTCVHFLDNVIEVNRYPLEEISLRTRENRKIGLGVMGFADMLIKLNIPYNSDSAISIGKEIMAFINNESKKASMELGKKRGSFPNFQGSIHDNGNGRLMRNATVTTIAPTGSISIIAGCSSGIEPLFAISYIRKVLDGNELLEVHPLFMKTAKERGFYSEGLMKRIAEKGSIQNIQEIPEDLRRVFITAHDVDPKWHIKIQAAFQKFTDNAVSKTINFAHDAAPEDIKKAYLMAYYEGCKGITIYRDRSRDKQVLNIQRKEKESRIEPRSRPMRTHGVTERISTGCGRLYVTINSDQQGICEVFAQMGKTGACAACQNEATGRLISLALRSGIKVESVIKQLAGIRCPSPAWENSHQVLSCPDAISKVLNGYTKSGITTSATLMGACPDCGGALEPDNGCLICRFCGFSRCS